MESSKRKRVSHPRAKKRTAGKNRKRKVSKSRRGLITLVAVGILLAAAVAVAAPFALVRLGGNPGWIYIPADASENSVADSVRVRLGESMTRRVMALWRLQGGTPKGSHGAYYVDGSTTPLRISRAMAKGRQTPVTVTFTGTRTLSQLAEKATRNLEATPEQFIAACKTKLPELGYKNEAEFPAAFIPDTYEMYWTADPEKVVSKLADETSKFWTPQRREKAKQMGLTPVDVATIASIVEEETAARDERPLVARLYLNRLACGMKLQADPTVKFATGRFDLRRITGAHLGIQSPYNTYLHTGLPPGPIRVAERQTLIDVLQAPSHNYLYMCAREDFSGRHNFARDYATHRANAARYQQALDRRGIH